jgi:predicted transcriptional regulator
MSECVINGSQVISLTVEIVAAFVSNNSLPVAELPSLIQSVHAAVTRATTGADAVLKAEAKAPAVPIRKSITPEFIICLEDGLKFKSLKRHLGTLGMTPDQYREKWGLPTDYPMAAPIYAAKRSALAKRIGLGRQLRKSRSDPTATEPVKAKRPRSVAGAAR